MKNPVRFTLDTRPVAGALALVAVLAGLATPAAGAPAMGDSYFYQVVNAYNREVLGKVHYPVGHPGQSRGGYGAHRDPDQGRQLAAGRNREPRRADGI
jgi:hypothetical protein